jgi:hypothetical protein
MSLVVERSLNSLPAQRVCERNGSRNHFDSKPSGIDRTVAENNGLTDGQPLRAHQTGGCIESVVHAAICIGRQKEFRRR